MSAARTSPDRPALPQPGFTGASVKFLCALARNNRREWFHARRAEFDMHVHLPMVAIVEQLALDLPRVAPDFVASPKLSMFRIWRDTRFSADKKPLKTNVAAVFPHRALGRMVGAGLYFEVAPKHVWIGGGLYAPDSPTLHAVRAHIARHHQQLAKIAAAPAFMRILGEIHGDATSRMPRGFDAAHPAAEMLKRKQFLASREEPAEFAARPDFYRQLLDTFAAMAPFVAFLNEPIVAMHARARRDPLLADQARGRFERTPR